MVPCPCDNFKFYLKTKVGTSTGNVLHILVHLATHLITYITHRGMIDRCSTGNSVHGKWRGRSLICKEPKAQSAMRPPKTSPIKNGHTIGRGNSNDQEKNQPQWHFFYYDTHPCREPYLEGLRKTLTREAVPPAFQNSSMELPSEAASRSIALEFSNILRSLKLYCRIHKSPPLVPILTCINPVHTSSHLSMIHLNVIHPTTSWSSRWLSHQYASRIHLLPVRATFPSHSPSLTLSLLYFYNYTWRRVQVAKLLIMHFSPTSCHVSSPRSKYSPQHSMFFHGAFRIGSSITRSTRSTASCISHFTLKYRVVYYSL
jgi:hypothetical protein